MSSAGQNADDSSKAFTECRVELAGIRFKYRTGGQGKGVIILHDGDRAQPSPLESLLSMEFRVLTLMASRTELGAAQQSSHWLRELVNMLAHTAGVDDSERLALGQYRQQCAACAADYSGAARANRCAGTDRTTTNFFGTSRAFEPVRS